MKYLIENANGRTLFFIDELGSGSDPNLGGAFAEVILEELARKHAMGIVTTHYLNLKVNGNKTPGIINGAMAFDEKACFRCISSSSVNQEVPTHSPLLKELVWISAWYNGQKCW